jgi:hypothetical protein
MLFVKNISLFSCIYENYCISLLHQITINLKNKDMKTIRFHRNENYYMLSESGKTSDFFLLDCRGNINLKKNGYPTAKNYISLNLYGLFDYGEDDRYELTYLGVSKSNPNFFYFKAKKKYEIYSGLIFSPTGFDLRAFGGKCKQNSTCNSIK